MTSSEFAFGSDPDAHEHGALAGEAHVLVVGLCAEDDVGDVLEANERAALLADDELLELVDRR